MLTRREKYLMFEAFRVGYSRGHDNTADRSYNMECFLEDKCFNNWLESDAADAVTVADVLDKEANRY